MGNLHELWPAAFYVVVVLAPCVLVLRAFPEAAE